MKRLRALLVDDEPQTLKYIGANLRARGYDVLTAEDGRAGLKLFEENLVDLLILDIMMPGLNGFQLCQAIRRQSDVPVIILSARGQEQDIVRALDLGAGRLPDQTLWRRRDASACTRCPAARRPAFRYPLPAGHGLRSAR